MTIFSTSIPKNCSFSKRKMQACPLLPRSNGNEDLKLFPRSWFGSCGGFS